MRNIVSGILSGINLNLSRPILNKNIASIETTGGEFDGLKNIAMFRLEVNSALTRKVTIELPFVSSSFEN